MLRYFENRVLRKILWPKREKGRGRLIACHKERIRTFTPQLLLG